MQTHLAARSLKAPDDDVQALFAAAPTRKAVLFIHGFSGNATKTWSDFHELLPQCSTCAGHDLFFYGYDGLRAELNASAALFRGFLERVLTDSHTLLANNLPQAAQREQTFAYDDMVIVAHSLGAVISRRALVDATRADRPWARRIRLVLFAPAHRGARIAELALEASSFGFLKFFAPLVRFQSPLIDALKKDSLALTSLIDDTKEAIAAGHQHLIARKVVLAHYERIVENERFCNDPAPIAIPDTTHMSVCKPTHAFRDPLNQLEECL